MQNYSILNDYKYENKNWQCLDIFSYPLRTCLNGRNVNIISNKENDPPSIAKRVAMFASSFLFPMTIIGAICLAIKTFRSEEKRHITALLQRTLPSQSVPIRLATVKNPPQGTQETDLYFERLCNDPYQFFAEVKTANRNINEPFPFDVALRFLNICPCKKMDDSLRLKLEDCSIDLLKQFHPKDTQITIVSVGPGGAYQELVYLAKLVHAGYNIQLVLIDPAAVMVGALDKFCKDHLPGNIDIIKYDSLELYIAEAGINQSLWPDLFLLIDLTDKSYEIKHQTLTDYAFQLFQFNGLIKPKTVISYSIVTKIIEQPEQYFTPKAICCSYDGSSNLSEIKSNRNEFAAKVIVHKI